MRYSAWLERFLDWAQEQEDVRAALVIGSQARAEQPADASSNLDLVIVTAHPERYLTGSEWLQALGEPILTFLERQAVGEGSERRVLFAGDLDVDIVPISPEAVRLTAQQGWPQEIAAIFARGFKLILDKDGLGELIKAEAFPIACPPAQSAFGELCHDFLYHALWTAKKLTRGELWTAKGSLDNYMKRRLLTMLEWHAKAVHGWDYETWHGGRFLELWADRRALEALREAFAYYDRADIARALLKTMELFRWVGEETAEALALGYPEEADQEVMKLILSYLAEEGDCAANVS